MLFRSGSVLLEITDTGIGISAEDLPNIFEPFYSTKSKAGGTGLGLVVVSQIIEAHQGKIELSSKVGKGTQFRIILPPANVQGLERDKRANKTVKSI